MITQQMAQRREFLKQALATSIYAAPVLTTFVSGELVLHASGKDPKDPKDPKV